MGQKTGSKSYKCFEIKGHCKESTISIECKQHSDTDILDFRSIGVIVYNLALL